MINSWAKIFKFLDQTFKPLGPLLGWVWGLKSSLILQRFRLFLRIRSAKTHTTTTVKSQSVSNILKIGRYCIIVGWVGLQTLTCKHSNNFGQKAQKVKWNLNILLWNHWPFLNSSFFNQNLIIWFRYRHWWCFCILSICCAPGMQEGSQSHICHTKYKKWSKCCLKRERHKLFICTFHLGWLYLDSKLLNELER